MKLEAYCKIIEDFIYQRISVNEFDRQYNELFYNDTGEYPDSIFEVLDRLFADIDAYDPECRPEDEIGDDPDDISEQTLRKYAARALDRLDKILMQ